MFFFAAGGEKRDGCVEKVVPGENIMLCDMHSCSSSLSAFIRSANVVHDAHACHGTSGLAVAVHPVSFRICWVA